MADNIKVSADFNGDGTMDLVWAGRADTISPANIGKGLENKQEQVMGQSVTKLSLKKSTDQEIGGIIVSGGGFNLEDNGRLVMNLGTNLSIGTNGELNATGGGGTGSGSAADITETEDRVFFTPTERYKLNRIEESANNYIHPESHPASLITDTAEKVIMIKVERDKLGNIDDNANNYEHPATHTADMITDTSTKVVMTVDERNKLTDIEDNANNYVHPETHNVDMITDSSTKVVMTVDERNKLNGIQSQANNYVHPANHSATMVIETADRFFVTASEKQILASIDSSGGMTDYVHPDTHPAAMIVEDPLRQFISVEDKNKVEGIISGSGKFSGSNGRDAIVKELIGLCVCEQPVSTLIKGEVLQSDNDQLKVFRAKNGNIIEGTQRFYKDGVLIETAGYSFDATTGVFNLYVSGSVGVYTCDYNFSDNGKFKITVGTRKAINHTQDLYKDGVKVDTQAYTFNSATGEFVFKSGVTVDPAVYTASFVTGMYNNLDQLNTSRSPIVAATLKVYKDDVLLTLNTDYTLGANDAIIPAKYLGFGTLTASYEHTQGTVIEHNLNLVPTAYRVFITPIGPSIGNIGEFWIESKDASSFIVKNTGVNNTARFEWLIVPATTIPRPTIRPKVESATVSTARNFAVKFNVELSTKTIDKSVFTVKGISADPAVISTVIPPENPDTVEFTVDKDITAKDLTIQVSFAPTATHKLVSVEGIELQEFFKQLVKNSLK